MKNILEKLNLYKSITLNSDLNQEELIVRFKKLIDPNENYFFDELTKSDRKYVGIIKENKFKIRVKRKFMNFNIQYSNAVVEFHSNESKTQVKIEIFGIDYFIGIALFLFFPLFTLYFFFYEIIKNEAYPAFIIFIPFFVFIIWNVKKQIRNNFELFSKNLITDINNL